MRKKSSKSSDEVSAPAGSKTLVIAEKPSVATDLAKVLKVPKATSDYFENDKWVISSSIGHVVRLVDPDDIDPKLKRWTLKDLPIDPPKFDGTASPDILKAVISERNNGDRYKLLKKLLSRPDVGTVVNACDAGREGELIFHYVYQLAKCKLPCQRLWLTSMTNTAIAESFEHLLPASAKQGLLDAAICRSQADWLVGMTASRFSTIIIGGAKREVFSVGRVQTPTLMLIVKRELEIRNFVPKTFWKIEGDFGVTNGGYRGAAQVPGVTDRKEAERFYDEAQARKVAEEALKIGKGVVSDERKPKKESAPRLFDLTTLQREGNRRFGFSAKTTLGVAQALYEKHKALTYPRTDSQYLPEDYIPNAKAALQSLEGDHPAGVFAKEALRSGWVDSAGRRVFDNKKVSDHFAIIPTGTVPHGLTDRPQKTIYVGMNGHNITPAEVAELIEKRRIGPFSDFRSMKSGKNFTGYIDLVDPDTIKPRGTEEKTEAKPVAEGEEAAPVKAPRKTKPKAPSGKLKAVLYFPPREGADGNPDAFDADWPVLGPCPVSGLSVQHTPNAGYRVCPQKALEAGAKKTFSLNAEMLKSPISADDVRRLLNEGKTGLKKFVSNRTKRTFEAFLVADKDKGWWFEFPPRKPRAPKGAPAEKKSDEPF